MLAGAIVPALAETAALEAGTVVRLGFCEGPGDAALDAGTGACLPGALWPGARAAVGAVGEMSDPGTRGAGAFHSGRSAGLRLRPRLRRAWSGVA